MCQAIKAMFVASVLLWALLGCHARDMATAANPVEQDGVLHVEEDKVPSAPWPVDSLSGHWEGDAWRINSRGPNHIIDHLEISTDSIGLLTITRTWKTLSGEGGHAGRTPVNTDSEALIGVFNPASGEFKMVEMNEPGTIDGRLVNQDTIEFYSTQPGRQPSISLERLSRIPAP